MILWNTASKKIEARCNGNIFEFAPNEQKNIQHPDIYNHLMFKLRSRGLVMFESGTTEEEQKTMLLAGLKARWETFDRVVRNHRTLNKEREANKMTAEAPSTAVMDAAEECFNLLAKIKELEGERHAKVEQYLGQGERPDLESQINAPERTVETKGAFHAAPTGTTPGGRRNAGSSSRNT